MSDSGQVFSALMDILNRRRAFRAFSERKLERKTLQLLLEAAKLAPSAFNEQPWRYIIATVDNRAVFEKMLSCLSEMNQKWVKNAQAIMITLAKKNFGDKETENRWRFHDAGLALGNLLSAATALEVVAHPMAGFSVEKALAAFPAIPANFEPVAMLALGYHGDPAMLEMEYHRNAEKAPRTRFALRDFAFDGDWGKEFV